MSANLPSQRALIRLQKVSAIVTQLLPSNLTAVFRILPAFSKILFYVLLLLNLRSLPFAWHFRVFKPGYGLRIQFKLLQWRNMFKPQHVKEQREHDWREALAPVGANPFNKSVSYHSWASIDDSDFNMHLSNSSYAKTLDVARFHCALEMFIFFFVVGGWMPLAATHYHFVREVPMFAKYEVRVSIGSWDQKWLYVVSKFVTKPNGKKRRPKDEESAQSTPPSNMTFNVPLRTPAHEIIATPLPSNTPGDATPPDTVKNLKAVTAGLLSAEEPDGAILHAVSVSQMCFKIGRITVPPGLVLACNGFSAPPSQFATANGAANGSATEYSHSNPPPHWAKAKAVMSKPAGGDTKHLLALMKGGWRDVPEGQRWWDEALGGVIEQQRVANLEALEGLRRGIEAARVL